MWGVKVGNGRDDLSPEEANGEEVAKVRQGLDGGGWGPEGKGGLLDLRAGSMIRVPGLRTSKATTWASRALHPWRPRRACPWPAERPNCSRDPLALPRASLRGLRREPWGLVTPERAERSYVPLPLYSSPIQDKALGPTLLPNWRNRGFDSESVCAPSPRLPGFGPTTDVLGPWGSARKPQNLCEPPDHTWGWAFPAARPRARGRGHSCISHQGSLPTQKQVLRRRPNGDLPGVVRSALECREALSPRAILSLRMGRALQRVQPGKNPWSLKGGWGCLVLNDGLGGRPVRKLTRVGRSIVTADICGLVCVRGHHFIVVLVGAVDAHLGNPTGLAAQKLLGPGLVPYPPTPSSVPLGSWSHFPKFTNESPATNDLASPQSPWSLFSKTSATTSSSQWCHFPALDSYLALLWWEIPQGSQLFFIV